MPLVRAAVLTHARRVAPPVATRLHADGRHNDLLYVDGGPSTTGTVGKLRMKGREVFRLTDKDGSWKIDGIPRIFPEQKAKRKGAGQ